MKNLKTITALAILVIVTACETKKINPSSNVTIQDRTIGEYSGIDISTVFEVDVTFSTTEEKIEIEANENLHAFIEVVKVGDALRIKIRDKTSMQGKATLKAHITTSNPLERISVSGASSLTMKNELITQSMVINVDDASRMHGNINASSMMVYMDGASSLSLEGYTDDMKINASDASDLNGLEMIVMDVDCRMEDASEVSLTVNNTINLNAKGASKFSYRGDAEITDINLKDASQIIKID